LAIDSTDGPALLDRLRAAAGRAGVAVSLGSSTFGADDPRPLDELVQAADHAMYRNRERVRGGSATVPAQVGKR
jgi:hypothetical protein